MSTTPSPEHQHAYGLCPYVQGHAWCPPQPSDSRSPCPALNTLANHGYINRNGKDLGFWDIVRGLREGYNLSIFLSLFLTLGGFFLLQQWGRISLFDIARHDHIEHNASLVHQNAAFEEEYAPCTVDRPMLDELLEHVPGRAGERDGDGDIHGKETPVVMSPEDVGDARVRRERHSPPLGAVHAEIARGEMAIILGLWETGGAGGKRGMPVSWLQEWLGDERFPKEWKHDRSQGLISTVIMSFRIRWRMIRVRRVAGQSARPGYALAANGESTRARKLVLQNGRAGAPRCNGADGSSDLDFASNTAAPAMNGTRNIGPFQR